MSETEPTVAKLAAALTELANFLRDRGEHWADSIEKIAADVGAGDAHGARRFLQLHGGIGSLTDLVFHPMNHNAAEDEDVDQLNEQFRELDSRAHRLAIALLKVSDAT
jgi:hypothetical protein